MLSGYVRVQRMLDSLNGKLGTKDTVAMLYSYVRINRLLDSIASVQSKLNLKLNSKDTASLSARIDANKTGIIDTAFAIRSDLQTTNLALQYAFTTNSDAVCIGLFDSRLYFIAKKHME